MSEYEQMNGNVCAPLVDLEHETKIKFQFLESTVTLLPSGVFTTEQVKLIILMTKENVLFLIKFKLICCLMRHTQKIRVDE